MRNVRKASGKISGILGALLTLAAPLALTVNASATPASAPITSADTPTQFANRRPQLLTDSESVAYGIYGGSYSAPSLMAYNFLSGTTADLDPQSPPNLGVDVLDQYFDGQRFRILYNETRSLPGGGAEHRLKLFTSNTRDLSVGGTVTVLYIGSTTTGLNSIDSHRVQQAKIDNDFVVVELQHRTGPFWAESFSSDIKVAPLNAPATLSLVASIGGFQGVYSAVREIGVLSDGTAIWTEVAGYLGAPTEIRAKHYLAGSGVTPIVVSSAGQNASLRGLVERRVLGADMFLTAAFSNVSVTLLPSFSSISLPGSFNNGFDSFISDRASPFSRVQFMALSRGTADAKIQTMEAVPQEFSLYPVQPGVTSRVIGLSGSVVLEEQSVSRGPGAIVHYSVHACVG